jgi:hypothetical protein
MQTRCLGPVSTNQFDDFVDKFCTGNKDFELGWVVGPILAAPASKLAGAQPELLVIPIFKKKNMEGVIG